MKLSSGSILLAAMISSATPVYAQVSAGTKPIYSVEFKPGAKTTVVQGTVSTPQTRGPDMTNEGDEQFYLQAREGQHLTMELDSNDPQVKFTLFQPSPADSKIEFIKGAAGVRRWSNALTMTGNYRIAVFTENGKNVGHFKLRITLQ